MTKYEAVTYICKIKALALLVSEEAIGCDDHVSLAMMMRQFVDDINDEFFPTK